MSARNHTYSQTIGTVAPAMDAMACLTSATLTHPTFDGNGRTRALVARCAR